MQEDRKTATDAPVAERLEFIRGSADYDPVTFCDRESE
jgi:hypothetical protein